ncbi:CRISPR-associated helicase Cas3' [Desulfofundulus sp. TPOSR]|uniref:CRISPR-associated helicase Cas3' n=1 Tax=Desulfofundulus sp. TPOSR TaxID=2714340 RepID=UPI00140B21D6|nr:CRISPR-associated helicase Cas3' [Desulfofundulus sp. TPOSR]NHM26260.1 CRISPR-associated helicase Cas3' [Desulfofundulus sp. TPOSR]
MLYYAHKDGQRYHLLSIHLARVAAGAAARLRSLPGRRELIPAAVLAGLAHDFGKYTSYFQRYLRQGRGGPAKQHAFISGLWAAHLAARLDLPVSLRLAVFLAVIRHHQGLATPDEFLVPARDLSLPSWDTLDPAVSGRLRVVKDQVADLRNQAGTVARSLSWAARRTALFLDGQDLAVPDWLGLNWSRILQEFLDRWTAAYGELYGQWRRLKRRAEKDLKNYFDLLSLFSALIDADKIHAAGVEEGKRVVFPAEGELVERYRAVRFSTPRTSMEMLRENLYRNVTARIKEAPPGQRIFTITAPTGSGKTLAGMQAALYLRGRLTAASGLPPRIIYALPFTSIIDQTFGVGEEVLRAALVSPGACVPTSWLLKHHHLAEIRYQERGDDDGRSLDEALMLIESWQSEMVITTFVQLFHTLIGYENRMLKKFCRLGGAILILDEVQNIPVEYWPLVEETLRRACRQLDLRVILMTATRPEWFGEHEILELAGDPDAVRQQFQAVNRVIVSTDITPLTVDLAAADFLRCYRPGRSYLVVLNTIKSSVAFYAALREEWGGKGPPLYYLSTNIVPAERERRLKEIRARLERGEKPVLVSTQVVEAGVDLDFDEVWRDLGPVDSVVQVAGRCNRHFQRPQGNVRLLHLVDQAGEGGRSLASFVYGKIHTLAARRLFAARPYLEEPDFFDAVDDYFRTVRQGKSMAESEGLLEAMAKLRFTRGAGGEEGPAVQDFALIRDLPYYKQVFVCTDAAAEDVWNRYQATVAGERDLKRRKEAFLILKRDFLRYLVSVPADLLLHRIGSESRPPVIPPHLLEEFYDAQTGFKRVKDEGALIY